MKRGITLAILATILWMGCDNEDGKQQCGDEQIGGSELCDGAVAHGKSCQDFDASKTWATGGVPGCGADCMGLTKGTCMEQGASGQCGDGFITGTELCDGAVAHGKSCQDFDASTAWAAGGIPGCGADCMGLTKGTCMEQGASGQCGDGFITGDELCDGTMPHGKTCQDFDASGTWAEGGVPGCGADCKSLVEGTCVKSACSNGVAEEGELCDGEDLRGKECQELFEVDPYIVYTGKPECSTDCKTLLPGSCKATRCGNGKIEVEQSETCDRKDGQSIFLGEAPSCSDYNSNVTWKEGGTPGCSADCKGLSKGTCAEAPGPYAGILSCEYLSLSNDATGKSLRAEAKILVEGKITQDKIKGRLACGKATVPTYSWNLRDDSRFLACSDCEESQYKLVADLSYATMGAGDYACVFTVNTQGGANSYYLCPTTQGYPTVEGIAESAYVREFSVEQAPVDGTVIARWDFENLGNKETVMSVVADSGTLSTQAVLTHSSGKAMTALAGTSGYGSIAISSAGWSTDTKLDMSKAAYFKLVLSTAGHSGIKIQFKAAGSGTGSKGVALAYVDASNNPIAVGQALEVEGSNTFVPYAPTSVDGISNKASVELRIYAYGVADGNATVRIDEIIVTAAGGA